MDSRLRGNDEEAASLIKHPSSTTFAKSDEQLQLTLFKLLIEYFNQTMAHPFKWTYQGQPPALVISDT